MCKIMVLQWDLCLVLDAYVGSHLTHYNPLIWIQSRIRHKYKVTMHYNPAYILEVPAVSYRMLVCELTCFSPPPFALAEQQRLNDQPQGKMGLLLPATVSLVLTVFFQVGLMMCCSSFPSLREHIYKFHVDYASLTVHNLEQCRRCNQEIMHNPIPSLFGASGTVINYRLLH